MADDKERWINFLALATVVIALAVWIIFKWGILGPLVIDDDFF